MQLMIGFVEKKVEWDFEGAVDLASIDDESETGADQCDDRNYIEVGAGSIVVKISEWLDVVPCQTDRERLLPSASRGRVGAVSRIGQPALCRDPRSPARARSAGWGSLGEARRLTAGHHPGSQHHGGLDLTSHL